MQKARGSRVSVPRAAPIFDPGQAVDADEPAEDPDDPTDDRQPTDDPAQHPCHPADDQVQHDRHDQRPSIAREDSAVEREICANIHNKYLPAVMPPHDLSLRLLS